jgi:hypothetical protein
MEDGVQQRLMNIYFAVVIDEAQFAELVHEEADARPRRTDHFRQRLLTENDRNDRRACTHWKAPPLHGARQERTLRGLWGLSSRQAARSLFRSSQSHPMKLGHGDCHGDKKLYRCAHGSSCSRALHAAGFHRHRYNRHPGRRARLACNGSAGHAQ